MFNELPELPIISHHLVLRMLSVLSQVPKYYANWWEVWRDYTGMLRKDTLLRLRSGDSFVIRGGKFDCNCLNEVYILGAYEKREMDIAIRPHDRVLDVGAYIGDFTLYAAKKATEGVVFAFEPSADTFPVLKKNIDINKKKNVRAYRKGLYNKTSVLSFYTNPGAPCFNSLFIDTHKAKPKERQTDVWDVRDFVKREKIAAFDFIKMDCEGAEFDIIYALTPGFLKKTRCLVIEYHDIFKKKKGYSGRELADYLEGLGFRVQLIESKITRKTGFIYCRIAY